MARVDKLASLETSLRHAVVSDSFAEADSLLSQYVAQVAHQIHGLPAGSDDMRPLQDRTRALFEWIAAMVQSSRDSAAAELEQRTALAGYGPPAGIPPAGIRA